MNRYKPYQSVRYIKNRDDFFWWGSWPPGYDVTIEIRDVIETPGGHVWEGGCHKVVVDGPQPRPRSKTFIGESAWCSAERYAGDVVQQLQMAGDRARHACQR